MQKLYKKDTVRNEVSFLSVKNKNLLKFLYFYGYISMIGKNIYEI